MVSISSQAIALLATAASVSHAFAFSSMKIKANKAYRNSAVFARNPDEVKSKLSDDDKANIAKARLALGKSVEKTEDEEPPKLFDDDLYDDMKNVLIMLEKRVKEGPGSLSAEDFTYFQTASAKIKESVMNGPSEIVTSQPAKTTVSSPPEVEAKPTPVAISQTPPTPLTQEREITKNVEVKDISDDEGPAYDGKGGMGLASGTRNTYVIPGMDEMSPEEYRAALQQSVIEAQNERRRQRNNVVGNRASHQYLDQLGWGGNSASWKPRNENDE